MTEIKPALGMGATIHHFTDKTPATIIDISSNGKTITLQEDSCIRTDNNGFSETQTYDYAPNPNGEIYTASLRKNGNYQIVKSKTIVSLGERRRYYDYSF